MPTPLVTIGKRGWLTVKVQHFLLPPYCVGCDQPTQQTQEVKAGAINWIVSLMTLGMFHQVKEITVRVPVCQPCLRRARWRGAWGGMLGGLLLSALLGAVLLPHPRLQGNIYLLLPIFLGVGAVFGAIVGLNGGGQLPLQIRGYTPKDRSLMVRFRVAAVQQRFLKALEGYATATNPFTRDPSH
jgi:hypothetical protein